MPDLPSGTVAVLFTDVEGGAELWERDRAAMAQAVARHDQHLMERFRAPWLPASVRRHWRRVAVAALAHPFRQRYDEGKGRPEGSIVTRLC
jgi:hypothetical protein